MGWLRAFLEKAGLWPNTGHSIAPEKVSAPELENWLEARLRECTALHNLDAAALEYLNNLKEKRWETEHSMEEWEKKIQALGISPLSKDTKSLFAETRLFLEIPSSLEKNSLPHLLRMNGELTVQLQRLQTKLQQSSFAYNFSYLLERETRLERDQQVNPLLQALLDIDHMRKNIETRIEMSGYKALQRLCMQGKSLHKQEQELQASAKEFEQRNKKLLAIEQKHDEKDAELQVLQQEHLYQDLRDIEHRKKELQKAMQEQDEQLEGFFLSLRPALQQYRELASDAMRNTALHDTALHDTALSTALLPRLLSAEKAAGAFHENSSGVMQVLNTLRQMLAAEKLPLPAEQANTIMAVLDNGISTLLPTLEKEHAACSSELRQLQDHKGLKDFARKVEEAQYRVDHFRQQVQRLRREVQVLDEEQSAQKDELERQLNALKEQVKNVVGREVEIVVAG